jgi:nucleoside-diphosphate-sugar epimerase
MSERGVASQAYQFRARSAGTRFPLRGRFCQFRYAIDFAKLNSELGWSPEYSFETGLNATVRWYLENPAWWKPLLFAHDASDALQRLGINQSLH